MTEARDDEARLLNWARELADADWCLSVPKPAKDAIRQLVAVIEAKPRTITTAEELDALPDGSVVLRNGRAFQRFAPTPAAFDEYKKWRCTDGGFVRSTKDGTLILPATVLYEPQP